MTVELICSDTLDALPDIASQSVDAVITDSPYPCIKRDYGYWTVEEWWALIVEGVIPEVRRILKPTGSAVFILQPNSEHVGQMRGWLWEFMAWVCREWNMVQDAWWWNSAAMPSVHCNRNNGLMRPSIRAMVWCGPPQCYRNQQDILWAQSARCMHERAIRDEVKESPSGWRIDRARTAQAAIDRGGVTPFNLIPLPNTDGTQVHGAGTPLKLADWWTRYICPPGGTVLDPFVGSGTMMLAALQNGRNGIGIDNVPKYIDIAQKRVDEAQQEMVQAQMPLPAEMTR
jgi:DNA modification methylase